MNVIGRTVTRVAFLAAAVWFAPAALADDLPPPDVIGGPPVYAPSSIARPAPSSVGLSRTDPASSAWTSPPPPPPPNAGTLNAGSLNAGTLSGAPLAIRDQIPEGYLRGPLAPPGTVVARSPRFVRRARGPYDITSGRYRPRGPVEVRDEWTLAQPRMTLPAMSPDPVPTGQWRVHFYINRGNDFGFDQNGPAEMPTDRRFLVDAEHQTTAIDVRYGLSSAFSVGARVPVYWRGGGFMDGIVDWFHDLTAGIGFLDNGRPAFNKDQYRVGGRDNAFNALSWNGQRGTGLGRIELNAQWNVLRPRRRSDWRAAVVTRVTLPTGTGPFDAQGVEVGLQATVAKQISSRWDVYAGLGGTWFSDTELDGILYEDFRGWGFLAAEWQVGHNISVIAEVDAASRLVTNLANYPALSSYVNISVRWDLSRSIELEAGFTENLADQQGTIDIGVFGGFTWRL